MSLYAVCTAKGSPGVTTLTTALALAWGSPAVLADLDAAGGDVAVRYRDAEGQPLLADRGLVSLAASVRRGLESDVVSDHLQLADGVLPVLAGVSRAEQVVGLGSSWGNVGYALGTMPGHDVVADCGRVLPGSALLPVLTQSRAVLVLARPSVEELYHLRERLGGLAEQMGGRDGAAVPVGVVLLTDDRDRSSRAEVQAILERARLRAKVVGQVSWDPKAAARMRYDVLGAGGRSMLMRSVATLAEEVRALADRGARLYA